MPAPSIPIRLSEPAAVRVVAASPSVPQQRYPSRCSSLLRAPAAPVALPPAAVEARVIVPWRAALSATSGSPPRPPLPAAADAMLAATDAPDPRWHAGRRVDLTAALSAPAGQRTASGARH